MSFATADHRVLVPAIASIADPVLQSRLQDCIDRKTKPSSIT